MKTIKERAKAIIFEHESDNLKEGNKNG